MLAHHRHRASAPAVRTTWLLVAGVAVASVVPSLVLINLTAGPGADAASAAREPSTTIPSQEPSPSDTVPDPAATEQPASGPVSPELARSTLTGFLESASGIAANPEAFDATTIDAALRATATGAILEELHNEQLELIENGWSKRGTEHIVSLTVTDVAESEPETVTVTACLDSSQVELLDSDGEAIVSGIPAEQRRAINVYTLQRTAEGWLISDRSFPDSAAC
jgi:hypothetical protein